MKKYLALILIILCSMTRLMAQTDGYDPELPPSPGATYRLTIKTEPENAATFTVNYSYNGPTSILHAGTTYPINIFRSAQGYQFLRWTDDQGNVISDEGVYSIQYTMPDRDVTLTAHFDYTGRPDLNPAVNYFDPETGTLHCDHFAPGHASTVLGATPQQQVLSIIYAGPITDADFAVYQQFPNLYLLDFSRTAGGRNVPASAYTNLAGSINGIILPASVEVIGSQAFAGCSALINLTCYALTPPTVGDGAFDGVTGDLVVYVPQEALSAYKAHPAWGKHHIEPITQNIFTLSVAFNAQHQKDLIQQHDCIIEATNTKSGQKMRYLVGERNTYAFHYLPALTDWRLRLLYKDEVVGTIDNIAVTDHDVSLEWGDLRRWQLVDAQFYEPDGQDVTALFEPAESGSNRGRSLMAWVHSNSGTAVSDVRAAYVLEGANYELRLATLPPGLIDYCLMPEPFTCCYHRGQPTHFDFHLAPIGKLTLKGRVVNAQNLFAATGAEIVVEQRLNGVTRYLRKEADATGNFSLDIFNIAPKAATASLVEYATEHLSLPLDQLATGATIDLGTIKLTPVPRTRVDILYEYSAAVPQGQTPAIVEGARPTQPVSYSIKDLTAGTTITDFQQLIGTSLEVRQAIGAGHVIELTATSPTSEFDPVSVQTTVSLANTAEVVLPVTESGGITITVGQTDNEAIVALIFDAAGHRVGVYPFTTATRLVDHLLPGHYSVVVMAADATYNSFNRLSQLAEAGLKPSTDYALYNVDVPRGIYVPLTCPTVPLFQSPAQFIDYDQSYFTNKATNSVGTYATLYANVVFAEDVRPKVSGVELIIDVPADAPYVDGSAMMAPLGAGSGDIIKGVQTSGDHVVIPIASPSASASTLARCCIRPSYVSQFTTTAYVRFNYAGKQYVRPLGEVTFESSNLSFTCDDVLNTPDFTVTGTINPIAYGTEADIIIYDDNTVVGRGTSTPGGGWFVDCKLENPYIGSYHTLYVTVQREGKVLAQSMPKYVRYERDYNKVRMITLNIFDNFKGVNQHMYLDYNTLKRPQSITVVRGNYPISVSIDFSDNNPATIHDVTLYYYTNAWHTAKAEWSDRKGCWVCVPTTDGDPITRIGVDYNQEYRNLINMTPVLDIEKMLADERDDLIDFQARLEAVKALLEIDEAHFSPDEFYALFVAQANKMRLELGLPSIDESPSNDLSLAELEAYINAQYGSMEAFNTIVDEYDRYVNDIFSSWINSSYQQLQGYQFTKDTCGSLTEQELFDMGCLVTEDPEGNKWFVLQSNGRLELFCLATDVHYVFIYPPQDDYQPLHADAQRHIDFDSVFYWAKKTLDSINLVIEKFVTDSKNLLDVITKSFDDILATYTTRFNTCKANYKLTNDFFDGVALKEAEWALDNAKKVLPKVLKVLKYVVAAVPVVGWYMDVHSMLSSADQLNAARDMINYCPAAQYEAEDLKYEIEVYMAGNYVLGITELYADILSDIECVMSFLGSVFTSGASLVGLAPGVLTKAGAIAASLISDLWIGHKIDDMVDRAKELSKRCKRPGEHDDDPFPDNSGPDGPDDDDDDIPNKYPYPVPINIMGSLDPSGYIFEAVTSNRVEGATASIYHKAYVINPDDESVSETEVLWDAATYDQQNPLTTDAEGRYQWDVPEGLWQVRIDKQGYEQTRSEWLPVPPPQLDVNLPLVSYREPSVATAHAYDDGILLTFDTYMAAPSLTPELIGVSSVGTDGEVTRLTDITLQLLDEEQGMARTVFVSTASDALATATEAILTVDRRVRSYAGVMMDQPYAQRFDIEPRIRQLIAPAEHRLAPDSVLTLTVAAVPASAVAGRTLSLSLGSTDIATLATAETAFNTDGEATFSLTAATYGATALNYSIPGTDFSQRAVIVVSPADALPQAAPVEAPTASRLSGTSLFRGQAVSLRCATPGATIYYTTDGTCPCESTTRICYDGRPIVVQADLSLQAMAVGPDGTESEVSTFDYTIRRTTYRLDTAQGWNWASHNLASPLAPAAVFNATATAADAMPQRLINSEGESEWRDGRWRGDAQQLLPAESFSLLAAGSASYVVTADEYNYNSLVALPAGWTWLGYPLAQTMAPADALAYLTPDAGDCLVGQDGFIVYSDGAWQGTLASLSPTAGYMYRSVAPKSLAYRPDAAAAARARAARWNAPAAKAAPAAWTVSKRAYPRVMPVVARVSERCAESSADFIAAFAGSECRGVAPVGPDGIAFLSIYGTGGETLTFSTFTPDGRVVDYANTEAFRLDLLGTPAAPYLLLDEALLGITAPTAPAPAEGAIYDLAGRRVTAPTQGGIYIGGRTKILR